MSNLVGHILSIRFGRNPIHLPIIAQYSKNGLENYVTPLWNDASQKFTEYRQDSYFLQSGRAAFSSQAFAMSEQHKACSRAFRLQVLLKKLSRHISMIKARGGVESVLQMEVVTNYRAAFEMADKSTWQLQADSGDFVAVDSSWLATNKARFERINQLFLAEMQEAGITF